jgi:hypothetical protein
MPPARLRAATLLVVLLACGSGCSSFRTRVLAPNPLPVPSNDFETVWNTTVRVIDEYFDIASENRLSRKIVTKAKPGATLLEPWYGDSAGFNNKLESTLQTIRRFAVATVEPNAEGGYDVRVEVWKELEDLAKPERQMGGKAIFPEDFPVNRTREIVGSVPIPLDWIQQGRDAALESVILDRIQREVAKPPRLGPLHFR